MHVTGTTYLCLQGGLSEPGQLLSVWPAAQTVLTAAIDWQCTCTWGVQMPRAFDKTGAFDVKLKRMEHCPANYVYGVHTAHAYLFYVRASFLKIIVELMDGMYTPMRACKSSIKHQEQTEGWHGWLTARGCRIFVLGYLCTCHSGMGLPTRQSSDQLFDWQPTTQNKRLRQPCVLWADVGECSTH